MKSKRLIAIVLILTLVGGALGWYLLRTPLIGGPLTIYGNVDVRQVHLGFRVGGRITDVFLDEGDRVEPGTLLARLDRVPYEDSLRAAQAQRDQARAALLKAENGPRPAEIEQGRANVTERQADLTLAELTVTRQTELVRTRAAAQAILDQAVATRDAARSRLKAAQDALQLLEEGTRYEDIEAARADLSAAEANVSTARTSLGDTELLAPSKGVIVSRVREPGAIVPAGDIVFVVTLDEPIWVRAYVDEPNLGRVHPGQIVDIVTDTHPDRVYKGTVGFISPVAEFTPKSVETPELRTDLVYRLRIVVDEADEALRQGMPVTVRIADPAP